MTAKSGHYKSVGGIPLNPSFVTGWILVATLTLPLVALANSVAIDESDAGARILLVDDSFSPGSHEDGLDYFTSALDVGGFDYDIFDVHSMATVPSISVLSAHDVVIWTTGYHSSTLGAEARRRLSAYLDGGGAMLLSSEYFAWYNRTSFMRDYFHIEYEYRSTAYHLLGEQDDPITSGMDLALESSVSASGAEQACFITITGATVSPILRADFESGPDIVAVRIPSDEVSLPYRIVLTCFPIESMVSLDYEPDVRTEFLTKAINWLLDESPPEVGWIAPAPGETIFYRNRSLCVELSDLGAGIDAESIELLVDGQSVEPELRRTPDFTSLLYGTPDGFAPGSQVQVQLSCQDLYKTPNKMGPYNSSFTVDPNEESDTEPPYSLDYGPVGCFPTGAEPFDIYALIADDGTGIDRASLRMTIDDRELSPKTERLTDGCLVSCGFPRDLPLGETYEVVVTGQDLSFPPNQMEPLRFQFTLGADVYPPYILQLTPPDGAVLDLDEFREGSYSGRIRAWLRDFNGDVDRSSVRMKINGRATTSLSTRAILNGLCVTHLLGVDEADYNQQVVVELSASDHADPPNQMEPLRWTLKFGEDHQPPSIEETVPSSGSRRVPRNTHIFFMISEDIDPQSIADDMITVEASGTGPIDGQVRLNTQVPLLRFIPFDTLPSGATISV
ncbi:MAG: hypothetical protein JW941_07105, partial [Candidatus Coatesbacteria bacterium]|nr:hypothetical protein [Candidatus Coatesbacteria bacterium]